MTSFLDEYTADLDGDYYQILQISESASAAEIKKAYRSLALKYHPDKVRANTEEERQRAEDIFKAVSKAYAILSSPEYDLKKGTAEHPFEEEFSFRDAEEMFRKFVRPVLFKSDPEKPSALHGTYQATVGAVSAPVKGLVAGVTAGGTGLLVGSGAAVYGVGKGVSTFAHGVADVAKGVINQSTPCTEISSDEDEDGKAKPHNHWEHVDRKHQITDGLKKMTVGAVSDTGAGFVTGATVAGAGAITGLGLAGAGVAGTVVNIREGSDEIKQSLRHTKQTNQKNEKQGEKQTSSALTAVSEVT